MTGTEQQDFMHYLIGNIRKGIDEDFAAGRIPSHWTGLQLRLFLAERVRYSALWGRFTKKEIRDFNNDCAVHNL